MNRNNSHNATRNVSNVRSAENRLARAVCETLESRPLLASLSLYGTDGPDEINITVSQFQTYRHVTAQINGVYTGYSDVRA